MPAVDSQPAAYRLASRLDIWGDGRFAVGCVAFGIRLGVEFDAVGSGFGRGCDQFGTRVQKDGCPDTGAPEPADHLAQEALMLHGVPSGVRRDCIVGVGYERDLRRTDLEHQIDERADRISLDIELGGDRALDIAYVRVADMPLVGSRVDRNALRSERSASRAALTTFGRSPPRELRSVAILFMFTLSFVIFFLNFAWVKLHTF